tara:strand:+ start:450 stop:1925 length:1476 start_codon:yes stop_codon:yes gene_type:complete
MLNGVVGFRFIGKRVAQGSGRLFHVSLYINRDNVYYGKDQSFLICCEIDKKPSFPGHLTYPPSQQTTYRLIVATSKNVFYIPWMTTHFVHNPNIPSHWSGAFTLSEIGIPRFWPEVYYQIYLTGRQVETKRSVVRAIDALYRYCEQTESSDLDNALATSDIDKIDDILSGYLSKINNNNALYGKDQSKYWSIAVTFVTKIIQYREANSISKTNQLSAKLKELEYKLAALQPARVSKALLPRSLKSEVIEELYTIFDPGSEINPFDRINNKYRNNLLFLMLLHLGLRIGEALSLPVDCVQSDRHPNTGQPIYWINIQDNIYKDIDSRFEEPSLKNLYSNRQLPISTKLVSLIKVYIEGYRGRANHPFLFNSQKGKPLSMSMARKAFPSAYARLTDRAQNLVFQVSGERSINPHVFRHTCAVKKLREYKKKYDHKEALDRLRRWFGWSPDSAMPMRYSSAFYEDDAVAEWHDEFNSFIDAILALEKGDHLLGK